MVKDHCSMLEIVTCILCKLVWCLHGVFFANQCERKKERDSGELHNFFFDLSKRMNFYIIGASLH